MEFALESRTPHCTVENRPHTHWMRYIAEGFRVCVACEPPAMRNTSGSCQGDGQESDKYEARGLLPGGGGATSRVFSSGAKPEALKPG